MGYTIRTGMTLKDGTRLERGDRHDGHLPKWVVDQGHAVENKPKKTAKKTAKKAGGR